MLQNPLEVYRKLFTLVCQVVMVVASFIMANALYHDLVLTSEQIAAVFPILLPLVLIKLTSFTFTHQLSGWWRYVSIHDLVSLVKANLLGSLLFAAYLKYAPGVPVRLSLSVLIMDFLLCFLVMSGVRVGVRLIREYSTLANHTLSSNSERILIVGAGAAGQSIAREIRQNPHQNRKVVGFVDQDVNRLNQRFEGVPVLATIDRLHELLQSQPVSLVILANPVLGHKELRRIVMTCQGCGVKSKILPNVEEILNDEVSIKHIRDVKLEDLLGRPQVRLEVGNIRNYLAHKTVLVTGAAGSIGSEICRQAAEFGASHLILFDNAETPLFRIEREIRRLFPSVQLTPLLGDARSIHQVEHAFANSRPDVVFHAAAYKHVPMSECNPLVTIENNVLGSRNLADAADRHGVRHFVMISTDKAVNPTNIMGASKRVAESYVQTLARKSQTRFVTVRFGNVLGSNGSVVPIFKEQILNGGPITVTDRKVTRFFMTIPEAVQLVMQAGSMGRGGEIFVLNMGEQIEIVHLAEELIRLSGMRPYEDIDIVFTGLRPGEKLHEELLCANEDVLKTSHEKIYVAQASRHDPEIMNRSMDKLAVACREMDYKQALSVLRTIVPEFTPEAETSRQASALSKARGSKIIKFPVDAVETA